MSLSWPAMGAVAIAYLCGSIPTAYLAGRWLKGVDLRTVGSGNLGTTNVYRELGVAPAMVVLVVDVLKGLLPTLLLPWVLMTRWHAGPVPAGWGIAYAGAAVFGHARPVFLLWRGGGKGVATAAGAFLALAPGATAICVLVFITVVATTRFVSLASIVATVALPVIEWFNAGPSALFWAGVAVATFVAWGHRSNISRLRAGTEPRIRRPGGTST
mgnify:CR=1 FL=1